MSMRIVRINELIKNELSLLIHREFAEKLGIIDIKAVNTSKDLKLSKIYISSLSNIPNHALVSNLQKKAFAFQKLLAKKITAKFIPKLEFIYDGSQESISNVDNLLHIIETENGNKQ